MIKYASSICIRVGHIAYTAISKYAFMPEEEVCVENIFNYFPNILLLNVAEPKLAVRLGCFNLYTFYRKSKERWRLMKFHFCFPLLAPKIRRIVGTWKEARRSLALYTG